MNVRCPAVTAALVLVLCLAAGPGWGQTNPELFLDSIDVDVVNVEVVVTDRGGNPVRGLSRDDFLVLEDGDPVEVTNFYAVESGRRISLEGDEAGVPEDENPAPLPAEQRLSLVVFIDHLDISPGSRNRIFNDLEQHLGGILRPGDRVMVAEANPKVRVVQAFTEDLTTVWESLDQMRDTLSRAGMYEMEARDILREMFEEGAETSPTGSSTGSPFDAPGRLILDRIRTWAASRHGLNRQMLASLNRFVDALAGIPGRRAILFLSDGFPVRPAEPLFEEWTQLFSGSGRALGISSAQSEASRWDVTSELVELTEKATGSHVTFYTLEDGDGFHTALDPRVRNPHGLSRAGDFANSGSLSNLAWRTGGASVRHGGNVELLLQRISSDLHSYYSLGFRPDEPPDGTLHSIEVRIPGRRVQIRHTQGYRAKTGDQVAVERTMGALLLDAEDNPLGVFIETGREQPDRGRRVVLPILIRVPISSLTLLPRETIYQGKLTVVVAVEDEKGRTAPPHRAVVPIEIPRDRLRAASDLEIGKGMNLVLRPGTTSLAVGVRDDLSGVVSTVRLDLPPEGGTPRGSEVGSRDRPRSAPGSSP